MFTTTDTNKIVFEGCCVSSSPTENAVCSLFTRTSAGAGRGGAGSSCCSSSSSSSRCNAGQQQHEDSMSRTNRVEYRETSCSCSAPTFGRCYSEDRSSSTRLKVVAHDEKSIVSGPPSAFHDDSIPEEEEEEELVVVDDRAVATGDFEEEEEEQQQQVVVEEEEQVVVVEEEVLRRKRQCQHEEEEDAPPIPKVTTGTSSCGINCSLMVASSLQIDSSAGPGCSAGTSLNQQHLNEKSSFDNQCNATLYNNNNYSQHAAAGDHHHNQQHDQREQQHEEYIDNHQDDEYDKPTITTRFSDIIGHGAAKLRLDEMLIPLALPRCLADRILTGVRAVPASILLYGPPGCGKTKLAQAVAGEAQAAFLSIGPSDVLSKFVGESEASVKNLFEKAKSMAMRMESQCAVLFFDEIDALGMSRCGSGGKWGGGGSDDSSSGNSSRRILAELLIQLSKLSDETAGLKSRKDDGGRLEDNMMIQGSSEQRGVEDCVDVQDNQRKCQRSEKQMNSYSSHNYQGSPRPISPESIDDTNHPLPIRDCKGRPLLGRPSSHHSQPHAPEDTAEYDFPPRPRIIVVAATNRPEDCDPALLRRFSIRVLVGLPSQRDRKKILYRLLEGIENTLTPSQLKELAIVTEGWSGSDLESVTREAAMAPIRECLRAAAMLKMKVRNKRKYGQSQEQSCEFSGNMDANEMARDKLLHGFTKLRPVEMNDFEEAITFWVGDCADDQEEMMPTMYKKSAAAHYDSESTSSDVELDNDAQLDE